MDDALTFEITPEVERLAARPYATIIAHEGDDRVVRVPELPGLVTGGATPDEMLALLEGAKRAWIAPALALSRPVPEPMRHVATPRKSGRLIVRVAPAIHAALVREAERRGVSVNGLAADSLTVVATRGFERVIQAANGD